MVDLLKVDVCIPTKEGVSQSFIEKIQKDTRGKIYVSRIKPLDVARKELIGQVNSDIFLFLDDDIVYQEGLIKKLYSFLISNSFILKKLNLVLPGKEVGAVQGSTVPFGLGDNWDRFFLNNKLR